VTEPIKNNKGLKQGCSLSGLKFNHYIAAISAYLDAACEGVRIGRRKISHLMYADDIVITTKSREDMINALTTLAERLVEIGLTVNSQKSKVISQGPGTSKQQIWKVKLGEEQFLNISEAKEIKYLGVWFGGGRAQAHSQHIVKDSIWKRQRMVAIAEQSHNKRLVLHALWTSSLKASMLSGISTIQITQQAVQALNTMQNNIAKSILGVSETTNTDAVLGILGWLPMDVEIKLRRIKQWVKMIASPPHARSINRDILQYCRENRLVSVWYNDLVQSLKEFGVHQNKEDYPGDTKNITRWVNHHVWKEWSKRMYERKTPFPYAASKIFLFRPEIDEETKNGLYQVMAGDRWSILGSFKTGICVMCDREYESWTQHILRNCNGRGHTPTGQGISDTQIIAVFRSNDTEALKILGKAFTSWTQKRKLIEIEQEKRSQ
jgi:hypothetical protein